MFLGALLALAACAVDRSGLYIGEGGTPLVDAGGDARDIDAPGVDLGPVDLGNEDLGGSDLGREDLGSRDLGGTDLGTDLGTDAGVDPCAVPRTHRSCRELRDDTCVVPPAASGLHEIDVDGPGARAPFDVWCDMEIEGGGWTLYGRTDNTEETFGWTTPFGSPSVDSMPYSLGLGSAFAFTEVIVGKRNAGKDWAMNPVFHFTVPAGFVITYATSAYAITDLRVVQGGCMPAGGAPSMLRYAGHTNADDHFFFRDLSGFDVYGMRGDDWSLFDNSCDMSGTLDGQSGMIMVR